MRTRLIPLLAAVFFLVPAFTVSAQNGGVVSSSGGGKGKDAPYLIPQTVFVGDRGRLVFPLGSAFSGVENRVIQGIENLPQSGDLVIHRVELVHRADSAQLLIDFQAYVPGIVKLPPIEIASYTFRDFEVNITSILGPSDRRDLVLSGPADLLAAPGTAMMIYGAILLLIGGLFALTLGRFWGKTRLPALRERFRRRRIIRAMGKSLRRLRNNLSKERSGLSTDGNNDREILAELSRGFRTFMGLLTRENCRAMVPREFLSLPSLGGGEYLTGDFISSLFRRCDILRFSGGAVEKTEVLGLLDDFKRFTAALDKAEREKARPPVPAAPQTAAAGGLR
jgi:hypothetical protein